MKPSFSELQFAYGITREIEDGLVWGQVGIPTFPNLNQEANLGFDVAFNTNVPAIPIFLQYKVPVKLTRKNATE